MDMLGWKTKHLNFSSQASRLSRGRIKTNRQQTNKQTNKQTDRQTDKQTN